MHHRRPAAAPPCESGRRTSPLLPKSSGTTPVRQCSMEGTSDLPAQGVVMSQHRFSVTLGTCTVLPILLAACGITASVVLAAQSRVEPSPPPGAAPQPVAPGVQRADTLG